MGRAFWWLRASIEFEDQIEKVKVVGTTGFEPATSRTPSVRATRLRHVPTLAMSISVSLVFEKGQDSAKFFLQIEQQFAIEARGRIGPRHGLQSRAGALPQPRQAPWLRRSVAPRLRFAFRRDAFAHRQS